MATHGRRNNNYLDVRESFSKVWWEGPGRLQLWTMRDGRPCYADIGDDAYTVIQ
jgi:hypothetical protein